MIDVARFNAGSVDLSDWPTRPELMIADDPAAVTFLKEIALRTVPAVIAIRDGRVLGYVVGEDAADEEALMYVLRDQIRPVPGVPTNGSANLSSHEPLTRHHPT